ncbi:MAG: amidohydrolase family protein [Mycobacteriaceae bacterium]|nr:amidohydrolase family protein [Mycobacteriaceae bacterium]
MLIHRAALLDGRIADVRVAERVLDVATALRPSPGEDVLDAHLGALVPGLHDHHIHVRAAAAALDSAAVGPPAVRTSEDLATALATAQPGADGWIRAIGYHDSVAGALDHTRLDELVPHIPLRVQHRSGVLWILNSPALRRVGLPDHPDGRLRSDDHTWSAALPRRDPDIAELSRRLAGYGVTGLTDATPELTADDAARLKHQMRQRLHRLAPGKKILHDDRLDVDALTRWIADRHGTGAPVAVHCVTAAQLVVTIAALKAAGPRPRDRIEHAAIVPDDALADLADLGVTVVTQPNFLAERAEQYRTDVPAEERPWLWRLASLLNAGIPVAASTDAPFGALDPWAAMRAAVARNQAERVSPQQALRLFLGAADDPTRPRGVAPGEPADLCVLTLPPAAALRELASDMVAATVVAGEAITTG